MKIADRNMSRRYSQSFAWLAMVLGTGWRAVTMLQCHRCRRHESVVLTTAKRTASVC